MSGQRSRGPGLGTRWPQAACQVACPPTKRLPAASSRSLGTHGSKADLIREHTEAGHAEIPWRWNVAARKRYNRMVRRADKADKIQKLLAELYPTVDAPLDHTDPYTLLVAVLLSAQCTDVRVNQVTPSLFALANNPAAMAELDASEIEDIIRPCGLSPAKSKNIRKLSEMLVGQHAGEVPKTLEELEELPGVGHKTASVVIAQAFGVPAFPVDTHIQRLAGRWGLSKANNVAVVERDLKKLYDKNLWNDLHLQIIFFGREYCPARSHDFSTCPICSWAASKKRADDEERAMRETKRKTAETRKKAAAAKEKAAAKKKTVANNKTASGSKKTSSSRKRKKSA